MKFNLREHLNKLDIKSDNKYDLRNLYDSCNLTESQKEKLIKLVASDKVSTRTIYESLLNMYEGFEDKYDDAYVEFEGDEPKFAYDTYGDASKGIVSSGIGDYYYGQGETPKRHLKYLKDKKYYDLDKDGKPVFEESLTENVVSMDALKRELTDAIKKFIVQWGYDEDFMQYIVIDITKSKESTRERYYRIEIRTELDYDELWDLTEVLNQIIQKYDKDSYFDFLSYTTLIAMVLVPNTDEDDWEDTWDAIDKLYKKEELSEDIIETNPRTGSTIKITNHLKSDPKKIASRIRQGKLAKETTPWGDDVNYSASDKNFDVQFQDRESHTYEANRYNKQPKVKSYTWGRVWKDGKLVANLNGPKYKVRADIARELDKDEPFADGMLAYEESLKESVDEGNVSVSCAYCGKKQKAKVTFPAFNKPFEDTTFTCVECGEENALTDPHKYNDDGTIEEDLEQDVKDKYVVKDAHKKFGMDMDELKASEFVKEVTPVVKYDVQMFNVLTTDDVLYTLLPISLSQVDVYDSNEDLVESHVFIKNLDDEVFNSADASCVYRVVGGDYEGEYTLDELKALPIFKGEYFTHRNVELNDQPRLDGYVGPMIDGWKDGHRRVIRYDTQEIYDMLSR